MMPSIKDFEKKNNEKRELEKVSRTLKHPKQQSKSSTTKGEEMDTPKRRPSKESRSKVTSNEEIQGDVDNVKVTEPTPIADAEPVRVMEPEDVIDDSNASGAENPQVHIEFPGSFILRSKFTKTFDVMDKVATDWIYDGDFEGLPVGHPLLQIVTAKSLKKAKEIEKKAQNTQIYALAKIGFEFAKSKLKK